MGIGCRGIRGAITVDSDGDGPVWEATGELLDRLVADNGCAPGDLAAVIFTVTPDLPAARPAAAARAWGWDAVPLLTVLEHGGGAGLSRCVRVLLLWNTGRPQGSIRHAYLRDAATLRQGLAGGVL
jgi:chorismate mutase